MGKRPHLLITRPLERSLLIQAPLERVGFQTTLEPLISYQTVTPSPAWPNKARAIIVTSLKGLECLVRLTSDRTTPLWIVGSHSQKEACRLGFRNVFCGGINQKALIQKLTQQIQPFEGPLVYASGETVHGATDAILQAQGYDVRRVILYRTVPSISFQAETQQALKHQGFDGVVFFSRETSRIFYQNMSSFEKSICTYMDVFALSERVLEPVRALLWRSQRWSVRPTWFCLFRLLRSHYNVITP